MTPGAVHRAVSAAFLMGSVSASAPGEAQVVAVSGGEGAVYEVLTSAIAQALELRPGIVRIEVIGGLLAAVDSVAVVGGATDRWIATLWGSGGVSRRFVRVGERRLTPVAARTLERGEAVRAEDVRMEERVLWGVMRRPSVPAVGMVTTRVVTEGEALTAPSVRPPLFVRGGDEVEAVLEREGINMRVQAKALGSAREGQSVYIRLTSGKRMAGTAIGPGLVHLTPGGA